MKNIVHAIWRRVLYEFLDQGLKISSVKISPYAINARGATQKTIEDNFSIQIDGHSYTVSEFIDVLSAEFTRLLTSSKSALVANQRNLTRNKSNSSLGEDLHESMSFYGIPVELYVETE